MGKMASARGEPNIPVPEGNLICPVCRDVFQLRLGSPTLEGKVRFEAGGIGWLVKCPDSQHRLLAINRHTIDAHPQLKCRCPLLPDSAPKYVMYVRVSKSTSDNGKVLREVKCRRCAAILKIQCEL
jgi:hypothetical protein